MEALKQAMLEYAQAIRDCRDSGGCIAVNPYRKEQENNHA